jgi:predicted MFS family arabinose efflux permease
VSQIGDWMYNLALVALVTHSAAWAGVTTAARVVPIVVLGPLGGVIADRFSWQKIMVAADFARMVLMLLLAIVAARHLPSALAPVIAAAATLAAAPYLPCVAAMTPRMVSHDDLPGANAARSAVTTLGVIRGPALGGVLLVLGSPALAFWLNAVTFGVSTVAVILIPLGHVSRPTVSGDGQTGFLRGIQAGAGALRSQPAALRLVGADIMCSLLYGAQTVLLLLVSRRIGLGTDGYGYLFAGIGVGGLLGTTLAGRAIACSRPRLVLGAALAAVGLPMPVLALVSWPAAAIGMAAVTGAGAVLVEILTETSLQRTLDDAVFGRAYGLAVPVSLGGIVAGSLIAPALVAAVGGRGALVISGCAVLAYAVALLRPASRLGSLRSTSRRPGHSATGQQAAAAEVTA